MAVNRPDPHVPPHSWEFKARFRRHAFGWKSQPAIVRIRQAVAEIRKVARKEPLLAAEGAVTFLERLSPALEHVDGSSGAIGTAVNRAIKELVPLIAGAPAGKGARNAWLERLFEAHQADAIPYIENLADHWGELCASEEIASEWAERLLGSTRMALSPDKDLRGHFHGTSACLSALFRAGRFEEIVDLLQVNTIWPYKEWAVRALAAMGRDAEALRYAEACRSHWASDAVVDAACEEILHAAGRLDEAYEQYAVRQKGASTYLAWFRAVSKRYPHKDAATILADLVRANPGDEGKWFAAAKDAGLFDQALALASRTPCDPRTLTRAARDYVATRPEFAVGAGLLALHWLVRGYGYEITSADIREAYRATLAAAERHGGAEVARRRIREMCSAGSAEGGFVGKVLGVELGL